MEEPVVDPAAVEAPPAPVEEEEAPMEVDDKPAEEEEPAADPAPPASEKKEKKPKPAEAAADAPAKPGLYDANPVIETKRERKQVEVYKPVVTAKSPDSKPALGAVRDRESAASCVFFARAFRFAPPLTHDPATPPRAQGKGEKLGEIPNGERCCCAGASGGLRQPEHGAHTTSLTLPPTHTKQCTSSSTRCAARTTSSRSCTCCC